MKRGIILFALLTIWICQVQSSEPTELIVASYNLRYDNDSDSKAGNGWSTRYPVIAQLIRFHEFDIFGSQEGYRHQLDSLKAALPGYDYIGVGRDDGKEAGEHSAIFYRTDRFELVEHGDFWLSQTPDSPSVGWDAALPRLCSWGHFRVIATQKEFLFFNLHMDHVGQQARVESVKLVKQMMKQPGGLPAILTGDFNVDQTSAPYYTLVEDSSLLDTYEVTRLRYATNGTYNAFNPNGYTPGRIDHVFVTPQFQVTKYGVLTDNYRIMKRDDSGISYETRLPSDHYPVMVKVSIE